MVVRQIRNATLFIDYAGLKFLIDPVFAQKQRILHFRACSVQRNITHW